METTIILLIWVLSYLYLNYQFRLDEPDSFFLKDFLKWEHAGVLFIVIWSLPFIALAAAFDDIMTKE